jgi:GTPase Era involved in 16S rRNA processing
MRDQYLRQNEQLKKISELQKIYDRETIIIERLERMEQVQLSLFNQLNSSNGSSGLQQMQQQQKAVQFKYNMMNNTDEKSEVSSKLLGPLRPEEKEAEQYFVPQQTKMKRKK